MSDYIGLGEKVIKLVDYTLSLYSNTITATDASILLQCSHKTALRIFKRLDLMAYEFSNFAINVHMAESRFDNETTLTIKRKP